MHPNPAFRTASPGDNLDFARARGFGLLSINGADGPMAAHVPFRLSGDGSNAELHLMRANPIARALAADGPAPALIAVSGPDGYISPDWYGDPAQVPTWNYAAVHLRGRLELLPDADLPGVLARLTAAFEDRLAPGKRPWTMDKVPDEALARMQRMICPLRLCVDHVDGTWKLSQNKPDHARLAAASQVGGSIGQELATLARLMGGDSPQK
ncbi:MAG TPA: FMN-binding negative transcriptional regulator [Aliiroseovarius sp.]|nr:FMN-binding negative transcriptional regulator [Aliiroseovarius sp.]